MKRKIIILCIGLFVGGLTLGTIIYNIIDYFESGDSYNLDILVAPERITCQIDSHKGPSLGEDEEVLRNRERVEVPLNIERGGQIIDLKTVEFQGVTAIVRYSTDDSEFPGGYPSQPFLSMMMTDESGSLVYSVMYDYYPKLQMGPINVLNFEITDKQIRLQCWIPR